MNATGFGDDGNDTFAGDESVEQQGRRDGFDEEPTTIPALSDIILYVALALGVPGNVLSAIVWLRCHVASENRSAVYLAALAVNDLVFLLYDRVYANVLDCFSYSRHRPWFCRRVLYTSADILEVLLVLSFSVVRLIAVRRPAQVCCTTRFRLKKKKKKKNLFVKFDRKLGCCRGTTRRSTSHS